MEWHLVVASTREFSLVGSNVVLHQSTQTRFKKGRVGETLNSREQPCHLVLTKGGLQLLVRGQRQLGAFSLMGFLLSGKLVFLAFLYWQRVTLLYLINGTLKFHILKVVVCIIGVNILMCFLLGFILSENKQDFNRCSKETVHVIAVMDVIRVRYHIAIAVIGQNAINEREDETLQQGTSLVSEELLKRSAFLWILYN